MLRAFTASNISAAHALRSAACRHSRLVAQPQPGPARQRCCRQLRAPAAAGAHNMAAAAAAGQEAAAAAAPAVAAAGAAPPPEDTLLQYVVLRRDLWAELEWPLGSVVAQGCHAATAALWLSREEAATQEYCAPQNIDHMHKASSSRDCNPAPSGCLVAAANPPLPCQLGRLRAPLHRCTRPLFGCIPRPPLTPSRPCLCC